MSIDASSLVASRGAEIVLIQRGRQLLLALAAAIYVFPGLVGHDPWKQDETYVTSIVAHLERTHDWIVPRSAGLPFLEKPPLYFAVGEVATDLFQPWLPVHDAARLANALWMAIVFGCVVLAAGRAWPREEHTGVAAVLTLMACIGLLLQAHLLVVDVALLAGFAVASLGFHAVRSSAAGRDASRHRRRHRVSCQGTARAGLPGRHRAAAAGVPFVAQPGRCIDAVHRVV
ncbi:MAG TPA: hypothetical protein VFO27_14265 [Bryobacteraceae bacterium]|nr:hypothetical protein [Bryobacteraceae bacterium]